MPLPFLKQKTQQTGLIVQQRNAAGTPSTGPEDESDQGLKSCAEDLMRAITAKDSQGVADAIKAAFQILEAEPHDEGASTSDESVDEESGE